MIRSGFIVSVRFGVRKLDSAFRFSSSLCRFIRIVADDQDNAKLPKPCRAIALSRKERVVDIADGPAIASLKLVLQNAACCEVSESRFPKAYSCRPSNRPEPQLAKFARHRLR